MSKQPQTIQMASVLDITGESPRNIANWIARLQLSTEFEQPGRGKDRNFSRENVLELALIAALVAAGVQSLPVASAYAATFMRQLQIGKIKRKWLVFPAADPRHAKNCESVTDDTFASFDIRGQPPVFAVLNIQEVVDRVDEFFGE